MSRVVRDDGFTMIPDWFTREYVPAVGLKAVSVAAYSVLRGCADADGYCFPSFDLIAHEGGMSRNTAARAVRALIDAKPPVVMLDSEGVGTSHRYRILGRPGNMPSVPEMPRKNNDNRRRQRMRDGGPTPEKGMTYPGAVRVPTPEMGRKYTHQVDTGRTHTVVRELGELTPSIEVAEPGAAAPDTAEDFRWGWHGLLGREQWDEYSSEFERVHGEPLRVENTMYFPGPDSYADALARLRADAPRGDFRKVS